MLVWRSGFRPISERFVSSPANAMRLNKKTPCVQTGKCMNCQSDERICSMYTKISRQKQGRMSVFVINEEFGY